MTVEYRPDMSTCIGFNTSDVSYCLDVEKPGTKLSAEQFMLATRQNVF